MYIYEKNYIYSNHPHVVANLLHFLFSVGHKIIYIFKNILSIQWKRMGSEMTDFYSMDKKAL